MRSHSSFSTVGVLGRLTLAGALHAAAFSVLALGPAPTTSAEVKAVSARCVIVERDATPMKCAAGAPFYPVATLKRGEMLRVDGEEGDWLRVEYLTGTPAYVRAEDVAFDEDAKAAKLIQPSRLFAINERSLDRGNWWSLLDEALPTGTALTVKDRVRSIDEVTRGYVVTAPAQARGYVRADAVRNATTEEALAYKGRTDLPPVAAASQATPTTVPQDTPAPQAVATAPAEPEPSTIATAACPPVEPPPIYDIETLRRRYEKTIVLDGAEAEVQIPVVIDDFKRKAGSLSGSPEDKRIRAAIDQRIVALQLRLDIVKALKSFVPADQIASGQPKR